jgi:hypothetical protein
VSFIQASNSTPFCLLTSIRNAGGLIAEEKPSRRGQLMTDPFSDHGEPPGY